MNPNEDQFKNRPAHSTTHKYDANLSHKTARVNIGQDESVLHVPGAEPVSMTGPLRFSGKGKAKDLGPIFKAIKEMKPKDE